MAPTSTTTAPLRISRTGGRFDRVGRGGGVGILEHDSGVDLPNVFSTCPWLWKWHIKQILRPHAINDQECPHGERHSAGTSWLSIHLLFEFSHSFDALKLKSCGRRKHANAHDIFLAEQACIW